MDAKQLKGFKSELKVPIRSILNLMKEFQKMSELFISTGGVHSTALCDENNIMIFREDIGRHNATDKIVGHCVLENIPLENKFLMTSGRISSEILIKSAKLGMGIVVSRSAPTSLAIEIAEEVGVTVVGFARGNRINVYTYPERIIG
jgi:FdhD protein